MQRSRQIGDSSEVAIEASSKSGYQTNPTASMALGIFSRPVSETSPDQVSPDPTIDNHFIVTHGFAAYAAFLRIAEILQLACMQDSGFNITAPAGTLPLAIAPTLQQQMVPHRPYVDMLPWAALRDRMLSSLTAINEVEFLLDMASGDLKSLGFNALGPDGMGSWAKFCKKMVVFDG